MTDPAARVPRWSNLPLGMVERPDGPWVKWADVERLLAAQAEQLKAVRAAFQEDMVEGDAYQRQLVAQLNAAEAQVAAQAEPQLPIDLHDELHRVLTVHGIASRTDGALVADLLVFFARAARQTVAIECKAQAESLETENRELKGQVVAFGNPPQSALDTIEQQAEAITRLTRERDDAIKYGEHCDAVLNMSVRLETHNQIESELRERAEHAEAQLQRWRGWAQLVWLGGGPISGDDEQLQHAICAVSDRDVKEQQFAKEHAEAQLAGLTEQPLQHAKDANGKCRSWCYACERQGLQERVRFTADFESLKFAKDAAEARIRNLVDGLRRLRRDFDPMLHDGNIDAIDALLADQEPPA